MFLTKIHSVLTGLQWTIRPCNLGKLLLAQIMDPPWIMIDLVGAYDSQC